MTRFIIPIELFAYSFPRVLVQYLLNRFLKSITASFLSRKEIFCKKKKKIDGYIYTVFLFHVTMLLCVSLGGNYYAFGLLRFISQFKSIISVNYDCDPFVKRKKEKYRGKVTYNFTEGTSSNNNT